MKEMEVKKGKVPTHVNVLPFETVGQVLRTLSVVDRIQCEGVNSRWKMIDWALGWTGQRKLSTEIVFEGANDRKKEKFDNESLIALFRRVHSSLRELDLASFIIIDTPRVSSDIFRSFYLLPKLTKLNNIGFELSEAIDFLPANLIELTFTGPFDEQNLAVIPIRCPNLKSIIIFGSNHESKVSVAVVNTFLEKYPNLKILCLFGNFVESKANTSLTSIGQLQQLRVIYLDSVDAFDDAALTAMATGCHQLRNLTIKNIAVSKEALMSELENLPKLLDFKLIKHPILEQNIQTQIIGRWKTKKYKYLSTRMSSGNDSILREVLKEVICARGYIEYLIQWGFLPLLIKSLKSTNVELQTEAAETLAELAFEAYDEIVPIVEAGAVPELLKLIETSESERAREQSLLALENIIFYGPEFRELFGELGFVEKLLKMIERKNTTETILERIAFIFLNICRWKDPPLSMNIVEAILPSLKKFIEIENNDGYILNDSVRALSHIAGGGSERIQSVIDLGVVPRLVSLLDHSDKDVQSAAILALTNIASGIEELSDLVLFSDAIAKIQVLNKQENDEISQGASKFFDIIATNIIQTLFDSGKVPIFIQLLICYPDKRGLREYIAFSIFIIATSDQFEQIYFLVDCGVIPPLCNLLDDNDLCEYVLWTLMEILEKSETQTLEICEKIKRCGGLEKIRNLRNHQSEDIKKVADEIIEMFYSSN